MSQWNQRDDKVLLGIAVIAILIITCFPFLKDGIGGYEPDLLYHLLRVEGVKNAILQGDYPTAIYTNFFDGYGYGSPLFYPDILLVIPALLRVFGCNIELSWKLFVCIIVIVASLSTYFSFCYILKDSRYAILAMCMLMLSQFYLADLQVRVGLSEYFAYIFLPIWAAGIYDFFAAKGKKIWLLGVGFTGMLLTHTIMTFLGGVITVIIFAIALLTKSGREVLRDKGRWRRLILTGVCSFGVSAYYLFPMLEQMLNAQYRYTVAFQKVGNFMQPFSSFFRLTGYFDYIAYVGIGWPLLALLVTRVIYRHSKNTIGDCFLFGGLLLFLVTTPIIPWRLFNETILNSIQFTYRFYPYALCFLVLGIAFILRDHWQEKKFLFYSTLAVVMFFGVIQNASVLKYEFHTNLSEEYVQSKCNSVGSGEWLPEPMDEDVEELKADGKVLYNGQEIDFITDKEYVGTFVSQGIGKYIVPRIYYKGYHAYSIDENGKRIEYDLEKSENGLLSIFINKDNYTVYVEYEKTPIGKVSEIVSLLTVIVLLGFFCRYRNIWNTHLLCTL